MVVSAGGSMIEAKVERIDGPADPTRCQAVHPKGQCQYKSLEGSKFCSMHGGHKAQESTAKKVQKMYHLAQWQNRVDEFSEHDEVKTLRAEIGILRLLLENTLAKCKNATDLLLYSAKVSELVGKIEKLVMSCNRLEASTGMLLDKSAALHLASQMVEIIGKYVDDVDAIDGIASEIAQVILTLNGKDIKL
jgi:hypothetical protein